MELMWAGVWEVKVMMGVQGWRKMVGTSRREETKLMIARRRFWGERERKFKLFMSEAHTKRLHT